MLLWNKVKPEENGGMPILEHFSGSLNIEQASVKIHLRNGNCFL